MLVSRFFGFSRLGVYEIAMQWVNRPMGLVIGSYGRVALTDLTSGEAPLAPAFNRYIGRISWTLFPILAILAALGPCLIPLLFGEPYRSAAEMAVWLVPFAAARGIASATTMVWVALKRSDIRLVVSLFLIPVYMGLIWGSATSGFNSFLVTFSCGSTAIMLILDYVLRYIYAGMPVWPHLQQWLPAAVEACALYAMLSFLIAGI
jgi:O-antigen/teichoic acid export membrane protein